MAETHRIKMLFKIAIFLFQFIAISIVCAKDYVNLVYEITLVPNNSYLTINLEISDIIANQIEIGGHLLRDGTYLDLSNLTIKDENNEIHTYTYSDNAYTINTFNENKLYVSYDVKVGNSYIGEEHQVKGYIADDYSAFYGRHVFLYPKNSDVDSINVFFNVPKGWNVFAPWQKINNHYDTAIEIDGYQVVSLLDAVIAIGNFSSAEKNIDGTEVIVATYSEWSQDIQNTLSSQFHSLYAYFTSLFGKSVGSKYLNIFCPMTENDKRIWVGEWQHGQGYSTRVANGEIVDAAWVVITHHLLSKWKAWAPYSWCGDDLGWLWIKVGLSQFYEQKIQPYLDLIPNTYQNIIGITNKFNNDYENYKKALASNTDLPLNPISEITDMTTYKSKAALIFIQLAKEIYDKSNKKATIDNFIKPIYLELGNPDGSFKCEYDKDFIYDVLFNLTDFDFTVFFNKYIYGSEILNFDWAFEDQDNDGLVNLIEILISTDYESFDTDNDGYSDKEEIEQGTNPRDSGGNPLADIKANDSDDPTAVSANDSVSLKVSIDPGDQIGQNADWWIAASTPFGWYSYIDPTGWKPGIFPYKQGSIVSLSSTEILNTSLPTGDYTFYFAIDDNMDGSPDATWVDMAQVQILDNNPNNSGSGSEYKVYAGNKYLNGLDNYEPAAHGYALLGSSISTETFEGSYDYYIIFCEGNNVVYVDTVQGSNGKYYNNSGTGNVDDHENLGGAPDSKFAAMNKIYDSNSFIVVDASNDSLSSITVYVW